MTILSCLAKLFGSKANVAVNPEMFFRVDDDILRNHMAISGQPGQGVDRFVEHLLTQQTDQGRGWILMGQLDDQCLLAQLSARAEASGRRDEFYVLDLMDPASSQLYNVLRDGTPEERAIRLLQLLPGDGANPGADHYARQCFSVLAPVLAAIDAAGHSVAVSDLAILLTRLDEAATQRELLDAIPEEHDARRALLAALEHWQGDDPEAVRLRTVVKGLAARIFVLCSTPYAPVLTAQQPEIVFSDILAHNKMCVVRLPLMCQEATVRSLARLVLQDIMTSLDARTQVAKQLRTPFLVAMKNFQAYGLSAGDSLTVPLGSYDYSRARELDVSMVPILQGAWDGWRVRYPHGVDCTVGNTFTKVYFHQPDSDLVRALHPSMAPTALTSLSLGEFIVWHGAKKSHGRLASLKADSSEPTCNGERSSTE